MKKLPLLPSELIGWNARYAAYKSQGLSMMPFQKKASGRATAAAMFSELLQEERSASTVDESSDSSPRRVSD